METDDAPEEKEGEGDAGAATAAGSDGEEEEEEAGDNDAVKEGPAKKRQKSHGGVKGGGRDHRHHKDKKGGNNNNKKDDQQHNKGGGGGGAGGGNKKRNDDNIRRRGGLTVSSIESDKLMKIADRVWRRNKEGEPPRAWEEDVVADIYATELGGGARRPSLQRVQLLEISQYMERYLWPHFDAEKATTVHVVSIIMMVNEKFREGVNAWTPFHATHADHPDKFASFFRCVMSLGSAADVAGVGRELTVCEKTARLVFLIHAFQSLEDEMVRGVALPLVSLPLWANLSPGRLQLELSKNAQLEKHWRYLMKKEAKAVKAAAKGGAPHVPLSQRPDATWLPALVDEFLNICEGALGGGNNAEGGGGGRGGGEEGVEGGEEEDDDDGGGGGGGKMKKKKKGVHRQSIQYCERFVEFVIDLLSQLPTRRFIRTVLDDRQLLVKARMVPLHSHPAGRLYGQLVDLFRFYHGFEISDHTGTPLTDEDVASTHCDRLLQLQRLCFKHVEKLRELALSHCAAIEKRPVLTQHLSALDVEELHRLATRQLRLVDPEDPWASDPAFLLEVLVSVFEKRRSQRQAINEMPLYPNEDVLWDENVVPSIAYTGEGCLALPKLNLQFLTFHDYLLRNFNLFRLEATYEIREDIADALRRMGPHRDPETGMVKFSGWARMAVPVAPGALAVTEVRKPNVGEAKPAGVTCEVKIDLSNLRGPVREEWDELKQHDVLFLLAAEGPSDDSWRQHGGGSAGGGNRKRGEQQQQQNPAERYGLKYVRGAEVIEVRDGDGKLFNDFTGRVKPEEAAAGPQGTERTYVLALDTAQYQLDVNRLVEEQGDDVYVGLNMLMRRKPKENNFKAILECIRDLMNSDCVVPDWLHDIFLGYGDPAAAQSDRMPNQLRTVDFKDTFLDADHLRESFPGRDVEFTSVEDGQTPVPPFRITFSPPADADADEAGEGGRKRNNSGDDETTAEKNKKKVGPLLVESYVPPDPGPYPEDQPNLNRVRFTPVQVEAIRNGVQPGLTMVVGPPGTGKTDTATQILHCLYHNEPGQRTLLITHSNAALNDLFQKLMERDVPARYLLRLGQGEQDLDTDLDFSRVGRVNAMLTRRLELLSEVERLATCLGVPEDVAYTCETAGHFWLLHVLARWEKFEADAIAAEDPGFVAGRFPFTSFFENAPQPLFSGESKEADMRKANGCMRHIRTMFTELEECRAFELLKGMGDRSNYLLTKQAKVVAMTCTHAALKRHDFLRLGFKYDNLVMEESAQILEIETFIPMLLQKAEDGHSRLKRVVLIGDHHQLPPVVKNMAFQKYCNMDQSLFTRFVRLGTPYIELNAQGRARPALSALYSWRYRSLGDLPSTNQGAYTLANPGFAHELQFVDVGDYNGVGETEPTPHFLQNLGEAEYLVSVFQYMRLLGYPANKISIITTYRGQKHLIRDVVARRCAAHPLFGTPKHITTVDKFQGQQNDFILLSLVRTTSVGHLRDVRRLVVAMSRARLGLYVFGRRELFEQCYELAPAFNHLLKYPTKLAVVPTESYPPVAAKDGTPARSSSDKVTPYLVGDAVAMGTVVNQLALKWQQEQMVLAAEHMRQFAPVPPVEVPQGDVGGDGDDGDDGDADGGSDGDGDEDGDGDGDGDGDEEKEGGDADMQEAGDGGDDGDDAE